MVEVVDQVDGSSSSVPTPITFDVGSPLYIHPSDSAGSVLVLIPFDGVGFRSWKRGVLCSLSVKNKLGFINGECMKPSPQSLDYRQWERCDAMVTSWILNSLSKDIAHSVEYVFDSLELWSELQDRYDQTNGANLYQIQKEINDLNQGTLDITSYYIRMKKLWEELTTLSAKSICSCTCTCGAKDITHKAEQDRRLIQFLMGLNEVYTIIRGSMLMMNPLPSMGQAFALLVQEEKQREFKPNNHSFAESSSSMNVSSSSSRSSGVLQVCEASKPIMQTAMQGTAANVHGDLLEKGKSSTQSGTAGIIACNSSVDFDKLSCGYFKAKTDSWILDSGATHHITFDKTNLTKIITIPYPMLVRLPNGYRLKTPSLKRPLEIGRIHDGLYFLFSQCLQKNNSIPQQNHYTFPCLSSHVLNLVVLALLILLLVMAL
ncbi:hypothetical protein KY285_035703 [Solanum tuberosum]|nr:hypothetical protein KY285_035703 [Solanum tuberosum]